MKLNTTLSFFISLLFLITFNCAEEAEKSQKPNRKSFKEAVSETKKVAKSVSKTGNFVDQLREHTARLKAMTPVDQQQIVEWFPEKVGVFDRTKINEGRSGFDEASVARAYYSNNGKGSDIKRFDVEIMDGAGPQGSMVVPGQIARRQLDMTMENDKRKEGYIERKGLYIHESFNKEQNSTTLSFAFDERYGVLVRTQNMSTDDVLGYLDKIKFQSLPKS